MISEILSQDFQQFILDHENDDLSRLLLSASKFQGVNVQAAVEQITARKKAKGKLPGWYKAEGIVWPPQQAMEQCSSEATAVYKQSLFSGEKMVDLTGGAGVDTFYLGQNFTQVDYVEPNPDLVAITKHNHKVLGANQILHYQLAAEDFVGNMGSYDLAYLDPSRRSGSNQRVFKLDEYSPKVHELLPDIAAKCKRVLIKVSPWLDLSSIMEQLEDVKRITVLAVENECRELLVEISEDTQIEIVAAHLPRNGADQIFTFKPEDEQNAKVQFAEPQQFLYEPNAAVLKAGAFKLVGERYGLVKLHTNTHLYTSRELFDSFPGRKFSIEDNIRYSKKEWETAGFGNKANISTRNFPDSVEIIKKKLRIRDGGELYIFACRIFSGQLRLLVCRRV